MKRTGRSDVHCATEPDELPDSRDLSAGRSRRRLARSSLLASLILALGLACSEAGFQPIAPPPLQTLDNLLQVDGRFCTEPPENVAFPVKVLFVLDQSASLQCTDPENRRFQALDGIIGRLRPNPNVSFAVIGFSSWSRELGFTRDRGALDAALDPSGGLGPATDYQGSLATAQRLLESDMLDSDPAQRARTRYVVIFVSDGVAEPRCLAGCEDDTRACADGEDNDGDGLSDGADPDCDGVGDASLRPDSLYGVCNTRQTVPDDVYVDYSGLCPAYNQPNQILFRVAELGRIAGSYGVGQLTVHTVLLFAPQEAVEARCPGASASFGYNGGQARALLQAMAREGNGSFRDVNLTVADNASFDFDFTGLQSDQGLVGLFSRNTNAARLPSGQLAADSDRDGLSDEEERPLGTDPNRVDTDGDGYGDLFEVRFGASGFDPKVASLPAAPCAAREDLDGDGLNGCEEALLETRPRAPDSDGDGMLDGLELSLGTDPIVGDEARDLDFDEVTNLDELRAGTQPLVSDASIYRKERIRYGLADRGLLEVTRDGRTAERRCYDFSVSDIPLTVPVAGAIRGINRVFITAMERPLLLAGTDARVQVACVEVAYEGPTSKDPASGRVDLRPEAWTARREAFAERVQSIATCREGSTGPEGFRRDDLDALIESCLPDRVAIDQTLYRRDELPEIIRVFYNGDLEFRLPAEASALFSPIETFDPNARCVRVQGLRELELILDHIGDECAPCPEAPPDEPDATDPPVEDDEDDGANEANEAGP